MFTKQSLPQLILTISGLPFYQKALWSEIENLKYKLRFCVIFIQLFTLDASNVCM